VPLAGKKRLAPAPKPLALSQQAWFVSSLLGEALFREAGGLRSAASGARAHCVESECQDDEGRLLARSQRGADS